jgi:hypothetical protein
MIHKKLLYSCLVSVVLLSPMSTIAIRRSTMNKVRDCSFGAVGLLATMLDLKEYGTIYDSSSKTYGCGVFLDHLKKDVVGLRFISLGYYIKSYKFPVLAAYLCARYPVAWYGPALTADGKLESMQKMVTGLQADPFLTRSFVDNEQEFMREAYLRYKTPDERSFVQLRSDFALVYELLITLSEKIAGIKVLDTSDESFAQSCNTLAQQIETMQCNLFANMKVLDIALLQD